MENEYEEVEFTGEELTIFKRYLEENDIDSPNIFRNVEENLNYYSKRLTSDEYFSPSELFWSNSNFMPSNEMMKNINFYKKSIQWRLQTVHPKDTESVKKEEKYKFRSSLPKKVQEILKWLDERTSLELINCLDLYIFFNNQVIQYLPKKAFVFNYEEDAKKVGILLKQSLNCQNNNAIIIVPVFIPIREVTFLGEFGFKDALINYGKFLNAISTHAASKIEVNEKINSNFLNDTFNLDGIEKSISHLIKIEEV